MTRYPLLSALLSGVALLCSCAESAHQLAKPALIPRELEQQIDTSVDFPALIGAPQQYVGRTIMLSGIVLSAKRTTARTEIEILELPSRGEGPQKTERIRSRGRFLAVQEAFLDPAVVAAGTPLTVIGEVTGQTTKALDEIEYTYPVLEIKHLIDWDEVAAEAVKESAGAYYGSYYYPPNAYWWGPYGPYPYWGLYPPVIIQRPPPPPTRPPNKVPPQFRKQ
jgi:outer membrane lipoprotein